MLQAPGTPSISLPEYVAPAFSTPSVAIGETVATFKLESTLSEDQFDVPYTLHHNFKVGQLSPQDGFVGLQVNAKTTHADGSLRGAILSGVIPKLAAGEKLEVKLIRALASNNTDTTPVPKVPVTVTVVVDGAAYTAAGSKEQFFDYVSGPTATDRIFANVPFLDTLGNPHPNLVAQFSQRAYTGTANECVDIVVEHCGAYTSIKDIIYNLSISIDGVVRHSELGVVHNPLARPRRIFWSGQTPGLHIAHDGRYLIDTKALPNTDPRIKMGEPTLAGYAKTLATTSFKPHTFGKWQPAMATTGGRPDIGLAPDIYVAAVISGDKRAKDLMLAQANLAGSWGVHRRDPTGKPLDVVHYSRASISGNIGDTKNPLTGQYEKLPLITTTSVGRPDSSHQPAFAYIPYLLTGDYFYLEEIQFWANFNTYNANPAYRKYEKGLVSADQVRGQGWSLRTLAQAEYIIPDAHPSKKIFIHMLNANMEHYRTTYTDGSNNSLGIITAYAPVYATKGVPASGIAPWQDDFFTSAVGHVAELGNKEAARLLMWKAKFQVGRMIAPGYCHIFAANYTLRVRETATSPYYEKLSDCLAGTLDTELAALGCNSPEQLAYLNAKRGLPSIAHVANEIIGYSNGTGGYPANYQPALAMAVDSGIEGGHKAWELFDNRAAKPDYGTSPQFAIVPRTSAVVVEPPIIVEPPIVVVPTPTPPPVITPPVVVVPVEPPPVVVPPAPVQPPVVVAPKVVISNNVLSKLSGLTVILVNGLQTFVYVNKTANYDGEIVIEDNTFSKGTRYSCTVLSVTGYTLSVTNPIQVI